LACCQMFSAINACARSLWTLQTPPRTCCASVAGDCPVFVCVTTANWAVRGGQGGSTPNAPKLASQGPHGQSISIKRVRSVNKRWQSLGRRRRRRPATRHHPPALLRVSSPRSAAQRRAPVAQQRSKTLPGGGLSAPSSPPVEVPYERPASTENRCLPNLRTRARRLQVFWNSCPSAPVCAVRLSRRRRRSKSTATSTSLRSTLTTRRRFRSSARPCWMWVWCQPRVRRRTQTSRSGTNQQRARPALSQNQVL